ncbi:hypothetical protein DMUE_3798 [Dictyocoela muelleri]|nr:hypothetical protein DMUE_3798 [Dictyocoela muelleri]
MSHRPHNQKLWNHPAPCNSLNKNDLIKHSLYNQLLLFGRISPETVKLNSTSRNFKGKVVDETFTSQKIKFMQTPPNTSITITRSFSMLEDILNKIYLNREMNLFKL